MKNLQEKIAKTDDSLHIFYDVVLMETKTIIVPTCDRMCHKHKLRIIFVELSTN